jgi:hypothetical protein
MWSCKYCKKEFLELKTSFEKANHVRWCQENPKRKYYCENQSLATLKVLDKLHGEYKDFEVKCFTCDKIYIVNERYKIFPKKEKYFCCKQCANSQGGQARNKKYGYISYKTIAKKSHEQECIICGFWKILHVHHIDENHNNNDPKNLVFLCANHHLMYHSRYKMEIQDMIYKYAETKWGCSSMGEQFPCTEKDAGSNPVTSTI